MVDEIRSGVASVRRTVEECARLDIQQLTLYCLSSENWKRPPQELDFLMHLLEQYMIEERSTILRNNIRVAMIGQKGYPPIHGGIERHVAELARRLASAGFDVDIYSRPHYSDLDGARERTDFISHSPGTRRALPVGNL